MTSTTQPRCSSGGFPASNGHGNDVVSQYTVPTAAHCAAEECGNALTNHELVLVRNAYQSITSSDSASQAFAGCNVHQHLATSLSLALSLPLAHGVERTVIPTGVCCGSGCRGDTEEVQQHEAGVEGTEHSFRAQYMHTFWPTASRSSSICQCCLTRPRTPSK